MFIGVLLITRSVARMDLSDDSDLFSTFSGRGQACFAGAMLSDWGVLYGLTRGDLAFLSTFASTDRRVRKLETLVAGSRNVFIGSPPCSTIFICSRSRRR